MANEEQLAILKQGAQFWNRWRKAHPGAIDFSTADLRGARLLADNSTSEPDDELGEDPWGRYNLANVDFRGAQLADSFLGASVLFGANLSSADLSGASLAGALLQGAVLAEADLTRAILRGAEMDEAILTGANLTNADLHDTFLTGADLSRAILVKTNFASTRFGGANLTQAVIRFADFTNAAFGGTIFSDLSLAEAIGLESAYHSGPSTIGTDTLAKSKGKIPDLFLRGCGLSDWEIELVKLYNPDLNNDEITNIQYKMYDLRATQALQVSPLFISYSQVDGMFVDKLESQLNANGIRFWRDIHDMKAGRMEKQIDRAIRQNPTVLLVLSEHSLKSDWVEHEVRTARALEKEMGRDVLCPVALDDNWKDSKWPQRVMEQIMEYNILDFSEWKDDSKFDSIFRKLIDGLELFYKG